MRSFGWILALLMTTPVWGQEPLHWSFKPVTAPKLPAVRDASWSQADLDRFILARLEDARLKPNPDADRRTLLRRASFDLTGLPPTAEEMDAFLTDRGTDEDAFARVIDRYLKSPRFGERWGRHWLDVVRYADSVGRSWNAPFTYAWRYRDYVIDALNADKPYDRFILEQIAGDLLPGKSREEERTQRIATGMLALGSVPIQEGRRETFILDQVDDQIDVTTRAFLGLTVSCARCHDHKTDAITMHDYYAIAGVFYSTKTFTGQGTHSGDTGERDYVDGNLLVRLPGDSGLSPAGSEIHSMTDYTRALSQDRKATIRYTFDPHRAMGAGEKTPQDCALRIKGDPYDRGTVPHRGDVKISGLPSLKKVPETASGRLQLAEWIASREHPLTARVMVNRIWLHLFGRGLVSTPDDFGESGLEPSHPELLDHLAHRFALEGWSIQKMIRTLMLSRTYRMSSASQEAGREKDPQNDLYWRMNLRRLEMEAVRDSLLWASGRLRLDRPEGIQVSGTGGKGRGGATYSLLKMDAPYRTVYLPILRSLLPETYGTFDFPDPCQIAGKREITTSPPQALFFMNSDLVQDCARKAAEVLLKDSSLSAEARVQAVYRRLLGRGAEAEEVTLARQLVGESQDVNSWMLLTQALVASAEFRYLR